jgi:3-oxoacyl-(acyl-carrier-protein) synthase
MISAELECDKPEARPAPETDHDASSSVLEVLALARWPESADDHAASLTQIPGFVLSAFNPLVAAVAKRCLERYSESLPRHTALVLASASGDVATARELADAVRTGRRVAPLLFFQSNPNAVLGHVASRHRLDGPLVCLGPIPGAAEPRERALAEAELLLLDAAADAVLVLLVEQGPDAAPDADRAEALLLRARQRAESTSTQPPVIPACPGEEAP